jgi:hypothetical protein
VLTAEPKLPYRSGQQREGVTAGGAWFRELTEKRVRRWSFGSVPELIHAIKEYLAASDADLKPLVWKASAKAVLDQLPRCKVVYETLD